ncbi:MAG: hypothetical protein B1H03_05270 [Planctomycetales bacterium 4484_113]|nr:MAG: hypothetical protein B1H03_05270 [Planctomycetales bacterium 4484_113]
MVRAHPSFRKTSVSQLPRNIVYGLNPFIEALHHGYLRRAFLLHLQSQRHQRLREELAAAHIEVNELAQAPWFPALEGAAHQGVVGLIRRFRGALLPEVVDSLGSGTAAAVLVDGINDPHNLGAVIRSAAAVGAAIILPKRGSPSINCTVHKASAGYSFRTPIVMDENLAQAAAFLQKHHFWVAALDAHEGENVFDFAFPNRLALIVGSEERRVRRLLRERSDFLLRIPLAQGVDSLNLSVAVGVVLFFHRAYVHHQGNADFSDAPAFDAGND